MDKLSSMLMDSTKKLQASVLYEVITRRGDFPQPKSLGFMKVVSVNIGSVQDPARISFWGILDTWYLAPYHSLDLRGVQILDDMPANDR
mmetsp:Transcript_31964/g.71780  ORF Transcript_31964/g.71780 Transcript_31964/m.71780 type:complete len:89 (-) Transcript_31964:134-400(-)